MWPVRDVELYSGGLSMLMNCFVLVLILSNFLLNVFRSASLLQRNSSSSHTNTNSISTKFTWLKPVWLFWGSKIECFQSGDTEYDRRNPFYLIADDYVDINLSNGLVEESEISANIHIVEHSERAGKAFNFQGIRSKLLVRN